jgi:hypothetical protein
VAVGAQHPADLGQCHGRVEPVEGLGHGHHVDLPVGQGQGLGGAVEHLDRRRRSFELGAHARHRLDGEDVGTGRHQQAGQLAGAGRQVEDPPARADATMTHHVGHGLGRVGRAGLLVGRGVLVEAVDGVGHSSVTPQSPRRARLGARRTLGVRHTGATRVVAPLAPAMRVRPAADRRAMVVAERRRSGIDRQLSASANTASP